MPENTSSVSDSLRAGSRTVAFGIAAIVVILAAAAIFLFVLVASANLVGESLRVQGGDRP